MRWGDDGKGTDAILRDFLAPVAASGHGVRVKNLYKWILADTRLGDYLRPDLWRVQGERQVYLTTLLTNSLDAGPALVACAMVPDLHHFSGRGAKDTIPLYRNADASEANILPGLLDRLGAEYGRAVTPEDFAAYVYGVSAHPAFTARFSTE